MVAASHRVAGNTSYGTGASGVVRESLLALFCCSTRCAFLDPGIELVCRLVGAGINCSGIFCIRCGDEKSLEALAIKGPAIPADAKWKFSG